METPCVRHNKNCQVVQLLVSNFILVDIMNLPKMILKRGLIPESFATNITFYRLIFSMNFLDMSSHTIWMKPFMAYFTRNFSCCVNICDLVEWNIATLPPLGPLPY